MQHAAEIVEGDQLRQLTPGSGFDFAHALPHLGWNRHQVERGEQRFLTGDGNPRALSLYEPVAFDVEPLFVRQHGHFFDVRGAAGRAPERHRVVDAVYAVHVELGSVHKGHPDGAGLVAGFGFAHSGGTRKGFRHLLRVG
jgi:hypothetical protein